MASHTTYSGALPRNIDTFSREIQESHRWLEKLRTDFTNLDDAELDLKVPVTAFKSQADNLVYHAIEWVKLLLQIFHTDTDAHDARINEHRANINELDADISDVLARIRHFHARLDPHNFGRNQLSVNARIGTKFLPWFELVLQSLLVVGQDGSSDYFFKRIENFRSLANKHSEHAKSLPCYLGAAIDQAKKEVGNIDQQRAKYSKTQDEDQNIAKGIYQLVHHIADVLEEIGMELMKFGRVQMHVSKTFFFWLTNQLTDLNHSLLPMFTMLRNDQHLRSLDCVIELSALDRSIQRVTFELIRLYETGDNQFQELKGRLQDGVNHRNYFNLLAEHSITPVRPKPDNLWAPQQTVHVHHGN